MRYLMLLLILFLFSCGIDTKTSKYKANPAAEKLIDSAVAEVVHFNNFKKAISLLDQAIQIDSNYISAYRAKLAFLESIKPIDKEEILATLLKLIMLSPVLPETYLQAGIIYLQKGDSIKSTKFLADAEIHFDKFLDTMQKSNSSYEVLLSDKLLSYP